MNAFQRARDERASWAREFLRSLSIRTRTLLALGLLLICFAALGINAYSRMSAAAGQLAVVRNTTLPKQSIALALSDDIAATHMKVFRFATLSSNGAARGLLTMLRNEIVEEINGEAVRLRGLSGYADLTAAEAHELSLVVGKWKAYGAGVRDLLDVGMSDAGMATMMLNALDEDFQAISGHLASVSWRINTQTTSLVSALLASVDDSRNWLAFGGIAGMLISLAAAFAFARSIVGPVRAVTKAMRQVSAGVADIDLGHDERRDEIGQMVEAIAAFRDTTQRHAETIAAQSRLIDVALNNMSHGLCMFDADARLKMHNDRYLEIFRLPPGSIETGCSFAGLLDKLAEAGVIGNNPAAREDYMVELRAALARGETVRSQRPLADGRTVSIVSRPLPDGGWVATHEDVTDRVEVERRIAHMAHHDPLTGLPNRAALRETLERALARVHRGEHLALHYVDLDRFKEVNDTLGHLAGDALLKQVAERLAGCIRDTDSIARLGGDEFAVVQAPIGEPRDAAVLAQRVQEALRAPYHLDGGEAAIDTSIGIAIAPTDGSEVEELLKSADMAVYAAKADGRGIYRFFELEMDQRVKERRGIETGLRNALTRGEFKLHYQPIVNLQTNRISTFEALIRWVHPERGMVSPADFIPIAEESGLIAPIGEWVLRQACRDAALWPADVKVAINLSPVQFNKNLVQTVVSALSHAGLPAHRLELEITESVLMQNTFATLATLNQLHDLGVKFSMDDFGTGYSSLSYLRSFPFDKIKIDRSFVSDLSQRDNSAAIIRAVTLLADSLDMVTTVEGVETQEQLDHIRALGCTEMQGYLYSPPRGVEDITRLFLQAPEKVADAAATLPPTRAASAA